MTNEELKNRLADTLNIQDAHERIWSLMDLAQGWDFAPKFSAQRSALESMREIVITSDPKTILVLVRFILELDPRFKDNTRDLLWGIRDPWIRFDILEELIFQLTYGIFAKARSETRDFQYYGVIPNMYPQDSLTVHLRKIIQENYLSLPHLIRDWDAQSDILVYLVLYLGDVFRNHDLHPFEYGYDQTHAMERFEYRQKTEFRKQVVKCIGGIWDERLRCKTLLEIVPALNKDELYEAVNIVLSVRDPDLRSATFVAWTEFMSDEQRVFFAVHLLEHRDHDPHLNDLRKYILSLPAELQGAALETVKKNAPEELFSELLIDMAARTENPNLLQILRFATRVSNDSLRTTTFVGLLPYLDDSLKKQLPKELAGINDSDSRDRVLVELVRNLQGDRRFEFALQLVLAMTSSDLREQELWRLVEEYGSAGLVSQAFIAACAMGGEEARAQALAFILQTLHDDPKLAGTYLVRAGEYVRQHFEPDASIQSLLQHIDSEIQERELSKPDTSKPADSLNAPVHLDKESVLSQRIPWYSVRDVKADEIPPDLSPDQEEVLFRAFYPTECRVNFWQTLLLYTFIESAVEQVELDAAQFQEQVEAYQNTEARSNSRLARGTSITLVPNCKGVTFDPPGACFKWEEDFHRTIFSFKAGASLAGLAETIQVTIYAGPCIVADLQFKVLFGAATRQAAVTHKSVSMYGKDDVFISYSRKDLEVARTVKNVLAAAGFDVFLDVDNIRSGQYWQRELKDRIERAQIFQLFWSPNYKRSKSCQMEWKHALSQNKPEGYIRPVFWKQPLSPRPPKELRQFNFQFIEVPWTTKQLSVLERFIKFLESVLLALARAGAFTRLLLLLLVAIFLCACLCSVYYAFYLQRLMP